MAGKTESANNPASADHRHDQHTLNSYCINEFLQTWQYDKLELLLWDRRNQERLSRPDYAAGQCLGMIIFKIGLDKLSQQSLSGR